MSEISSYEAQKKKMEGLLDEHKLSFKFNKDVYPISFTIRPYGGFEPQMSMMEDGGVEGVSPEASMTWIFEDGKLQTRVQGGTFTISKTLRNKIENILMKMIMFWQQYFFRDVLERHLLKKESMPMIDDDDEEPETTEEDTEQLAEMADEAAEQMELPEGEESTEDDSKQDEAADDPGEIPEELLARATAIIRLENKASPGTLMRNIPDLKHSTATKILLALEGTVVTPVQDTGRREVLPADLPDDSTEDLSEEG